eukprot:2439695-Pyramimonas_sp.AAC.1
MATLLPLTWSWGHNACTAWQLAGSPVRCLRCQQPRSGLEAGIHEDHAGGRLGILRGATPNPNQ